MINPALFDSFRLIAIVMLLYVTLSRSNPLTSIFLVSIPFKTLLHDPASLLVTPLKAIVVSLRLKLSLTLL